MSGFPPEHDVNHSTREIHHHLGLAAEASARGDHVEVGHQFSTVARIANAVSIRAYARAEDGGQL